MPIELEALLVPQMGRTNLVKERLLDPARIGTTDLTVRIPVTAWTTLSRLLSSTD